MENKMFKHSIKGITIKENKLLVVSCDYGRGRFCKLPGGGHQWGETMQEALIREYAEELGVKANPQRLVMVRDYIAKNHNTTIDEPYFHMAELIFECSVDDFSTLGTGTEEDSDAQEIKWIAINELELNNFYPRAIIPYLTKLDKIKETIVLGDVN